LTEALQATINMTTPLIRNQRLEGTTKSQGLA